MYACSGFFFKPPEVCAVAKLRQLMPAGRNREYISIWASDARVLYGRSAYQCYEDFMNSFKLTFAQACVPRISWDWVCMTSL